MYQKHGIMTQSMKFGYARVSTKSQELDLQTNALTLAGCDEISTEVMTGTNNDRPVRMELIKRLRRGDVVVVWRLDRFGRSMTDLVAKIEQLNEKGIEFISLQENIDTTSATGKLIFHIFAAMAEFERNLISERTRAGLAAARLRGKMGGRPPKMKPEQLKTAERLITGPDALNRTEVAKMFGVSRSTLYRELNKN
jgi:DNA invertase Pin-like site-specific DNA recombinase